MVQGLSDRLRELREKFGYSQKEVAKLLDVSPSLISGYENCERTPSVEMLLQLCRLYRCSADYLLGRSEKSPSMTLPLDGLTPGQVRLITALVDEFQLAREPK